MRTLNYVLATRLESLYQASSTINSDAFVELWRNINLQYDPINFRRFQSSPHQLVIHKKIIFVGDSHADFMSRRLTVMNIERTRRYAIHCEWLGPKTAFGLKRDCFLPVKHAISKYWTDLSSDMKVLSLFLVAGEIDIRCHFSRHVYDCNRQALEKYIYSFWHEYCYTARNALGAYPLVIVPPPPPGRLDGSNIGEYPPSCTDNLRLIFYELTIISLSKLCRENPALLVLDLFASYRNSDGFMHPDFTTDGIHVNNTEPIERAIQNALDNGLV